MFTMKKQLILLTTIILYLLGCSPSYKLQQYAIYLRNPSKHINEKEQINDPLYDY